MVLAMLRGDGECSGRAMYGILGVGVLACIYVPPRLDHQTSTGLPTDPEPGVRSSKPCYEYDSDGSFKYISNLRPAPSLVK